MTYGSEAIIPIETGFLTMRSDQFIDSNNERLLSFDLDLAEEREEVIAVRLA